MTESVVRGHGAPTPLDVAAVSRLLAAHLPQWADAAISEVRASGTQNAIFRLGVHACIRLPRTPRAALRLEKEVEWLPVFGRAQLALQIPTPLASVGPTQQFPLPWAIYGWIDGEPVSPRLEADDEGAPLRLANFLRALQRVASDGAPLSQHNRPLSERDHDIRHGLGVLSSIVDIKRAEAAWVRARESASASDGMVWAHGDLHPLNLLALNGRLAAVIDFGYAGLGDPAIDFICAWSVLEPRGRRVFREALTVDDATWMRARGLALHQGVVMAAQHRPDGPMLATALRIIEAVLADSD